MTSLWPRIEPLLAKVQKPARYIGCEDGARTPDHGSGRVAWLLVYPDAYEVGLPNQGLQILYEILNERDDAVAERAYAPWVDLEALMRPSGVPLFSVDTHRPASDFDLLAFNLSAELVYTNVLNCIDLSGAPVRGANRGPEHPIVVAGGHCAFNPEPLADFVDVFVMGDGEEVISEITEVVREWKASGRTPGSRERVLRALASVPGVYVPSMYDVEYEGPSLRAVTPRYPDVPERVEKRTVADLGEWPYPKQQLVPLTEVVHDRLNVEIFRGCTRGCRFCQAGMITRPVRERPADQVRTMVADGLCRTGYDEVSLTSLSSADFSGIDGVVAGIVNDPVNCGQVSLSLPSLRVDAFTVSVATEIQKVRRTGLTFAPEAGTWRLRQVINKLIREEDLYGAVEAAYSQGWRRVKLYFLTGLPTEMDDDTLGIASLARNCVAIGRKYHKSASVTASVGGFVPKPHTPFQWFGQNGVDELQRKVGLLRDDLRRDRAVQLRWHDPKATLAEGIASRGDRRIGAVIEDVWRRGGTFQEWSEYFDLALWEE
ncbi:MAG: TIGR03960 family B12-binding radical SAM protein, partial [Acidimicrobiia bacterium]|nr:TIGR03960 family B12-binding radical SAM protein [Acidimicrobiia bacterium]